MKYLKDFILESKKHVDTVTVADFFQWAVLGELPDGKCDKKCIKDADVTGLIDNGWFDNFNDTDQSKVEKEVKDFFDKNWDENIKVTSKETPNDWEVSFELNNTKYVAAFLTYFGDEFE